MNDTVDGMTIFSFGFEFQNSTNADTIKQYKGSSAVGIDQFCYRTTILNRKEKVNSKS